MRRVGVLAGCTRAGCHGADDDGDTDGRGDVSRHHAHRRGSTFGNAGTGFDADGAGSCAVLKANRSVVYGRAVAVGSRGTVATGNSWNLGGSRGESSVQSTHPAAITGPRDADGSLPSAAGFLLPRNGTAIGARL